MKYIKKLGCPRPLRDWIKANKDLPGVQFGSHNFPKKEVVNALLREQGNLCAYTMVRVCTETCHVEHIKPQHLSKSENAHHETWDYQNLLACYPGDDPAAAGRDQIGATKKGMEWHPTFISPLLESCESRFRFCLDGSVEPRKGGDKAAELTISILGLDCEILDEWRRRAIEGFGLSLTSDAPLSPSDAKRLQSAVRKRRSDGTFHGYCVAIEHAAEEYIAKLQKIARKKLFASRARDRRDK